jgi:hypothetical protein
MAKVFVTFLVATIFALSVFVSPQVISFASSSHHNTSSLAPTKTGIFKLVGKVVESKLRAPNSSSSAKLPPDPIVSNATFSSKHYTPSPFVFSVKTPPPTYTASNAPKSQSVNLYAGINGLTRSTSGGWIPPDVQLGTGPSYVVEFVNNAGEIWTKSGQSVNSFSLNNFFLTSASYYGDPKILYDLVSGRWFATLSIFYSGVVDLAVSASSDPTGSWNVYSIPFPGGHCSDQPILGVSNDKVAISVNDFSTSCGSFIGAEYDILNKGDLLSGVSIHYSDFGPFFSEFSVHPVQSLSSTSTLYMVSDIWYGGSALYLFAVSGVPPSTVAVSVITLSIIPTNFPPGGVQPGSSSTINVDDGRVLDAAWFRGSLWLSLTDACQPAGDSSVRSCARLIEVNTGSDFVSQDFDIGSSQTYLFYPALRIDGTGGVDVIFGYSSLYNYPSFALTGQTPQDSPNTVEPPLYYALGTASDNSGRYGDYFGAAVDPSDTTIVWTAGEYGSTNCFITCSYQWATFITSMKTVTPPSVSPGNDVVIGSIATPFSVTIYNPSSASSWVSSASFAAPYSFSYSGTPSCGSYLSTSSYSSSDVKCSGSLPPGTVDVLNLGYITGPTSPATSPASEECTIPDFTDSNSPTSFSGSYYCIWSIAPTSVTVAPSSSEDYFVGSSPIPITAFLSSGQANVPVDFSISSNSNGESLTPTSEFTDSTGSLTSFFTPSNTLGITDTVSVLIGYGSGIKGSSGAITTAALIHFNEYQSSTSPTSGKTWTLNFNGNSYSTTLSATGGDIYLIVLTAGSYSWSSSPIVVGPGVAYGSSSPSGIMPVPSQTYQTMTYDPSQGGILEYQVILASSAGGSTLPSGASWYTAGSTVAIHATASTGYTFSRWTSSSASLTIKSSSGASTSMIVNAPGTVTANFLSSVSISLSPTLGSVIHGSSIKTVATIKGASQSVTLQVTGLPSGVTVSWTTNPVTDSVSGVKDTLSFKTSSAATHGTFKLTVTANGADGLVSTATFTLAIN